MIPKEQAKIKSFRQQHGSTAIGQITVDMVSGGTGGGGGGTGLCQPITEPCASISPQVYGGMRGMKGLIYETSVLDPDEVGLPPTPAPLGHPQGSRADARSCWVFPSRGSASVGSASPSARSCCPKRRGARSHCLRGSSGCW